MMLSMGIPIPGYDPAKHNTQAAGTTPAAPVLTSPSTSAVSASGGGAATASASAVASGGPGMVYADEGLSQEEARALAPRYRHYWNPATAGLS